MIVPLEVIGLPETDKPPLVSLATATLVTVPVPTPLTASCTYLTVAISVSPALCPGVGAVGIPVNVGEASGAYPLISGISLIRAIVPDLFGAVNVLEAVSVSALKVVV